MKIAYTLPAIACSLFIIGCAADRPDAGLDRYYQPCVSSETWPVAAASFTTTVDGIIFYHGAPSLPCIVNGRFHVADISPHRLAKSVKFHQADAVWLSEREVEMTKTDHGVMLFGRGWAVETPDKTTVESVTHAHAYLIKLLPTKPKL